MKRTLLFLLVVSGISLPLACSSYSNPGGPYSPRYPVSHYTPTPSPTFSVPTPTWNSNWGGTAFSPNGLAQGAGTTVYVAEGDESGGEVQVYDSSNPIAALSSWVSYGSTSLAWPIGAAVHPTNGNVYVLDNVNNAVYVFTPAGSPVTTWTGYGSLRFNYPGGIAVDTTTNCNGGPCVYVADTFNDQVDKFDQNGQALSKLNGTAGTTPVHFSYPTGVALDASNNVYVADSGNEMIEEFTSTGGTVFQFSTVAGSDIEGLAVNGSVIFAADFGDGTTNGGNSLVEEYDLSGNLLTAWTSTQGTFVFGPDAVLPGAHNLVADWNNNLVEVF